MAQKSFDTRDNILIGPYWQSTYVHWIFEIFQKFFFYTDIYSKYFRKAFMCCPKQTPIKIVCTAFVFKLTVSKNIYTTLYNYIDVNHWTDDPSVETVLVHVEFKVNKLIMDGSQWLHGLRSENTAAGLLGLRFRIPLRAWFSVSWVCCVLSGRGLRVGLITSPEESYREWHVWVWPWNLDNEEVLSHWGLSRCGKKRR